MKKLLLVLTLLASTQTKAYYNPENPEGNSSSTSGFGNWFTTAPTINYFSSSSTGGSFNSSQSSGQAPKNPLSLANGSDLGFPNEDVEDTPQY